MTKKFIPLIAAIALFFGISIGAFAASNLEQITAYINHDLKLSLKGQSWQPMDEDGSALSPITYNGSTYLPARAIGEAFGVQIGWDEATQTVLLGGDQMQITATITFPSYKYPETARHIRDAIARGESSVCTIDRGGADDNRDHSLAGISTKEGYDRDEWPMAMCAEGGTGADVEYVPSSDNRGSGSWVGNALEAYPDGARIQFVVPEAGEAPAAATSGSTTPAAPSATGSITFKNCTEVKAAGKAPIRVGDPGYSSKLDRDGDGIACE
jgi:hypothetical protein